MDKEVIDFDDMILAPLVHKARFWQQDWVLIDEAQDTNPARRALARAMLKPGGRLIAVGDPRQAIFGFTGADADSMDLIKADFNCIELPLTVSYRCPKAVVAHAQQWVSHIEAHPTALDGVVRTMPLTRLLEQAGAVHAFLDDEWPALSKDDAILCRNTKPLVELAYGLIRLGVACQVEGRDIGLGLIKLARKWRCTGLEALLGKLALYKGQECAKLAAKGKEQQAAAIEDRVETLICMAEVCQTQGKHNITDLVSFIERLFGDTKDGDRPRVLTLSTVHKSKGREWDKVYLLGRNKYMPSKWARKAWQQEQEDNLCYVAVTRAKRELIEIMVD
jgi:superfamily I DNA/RNA helicase